MNRTDQGFDGDEGGVLLDQYDIAMKEYESIKTRISNLKHTTPTVHSRREQITQFRELVLRMSQVGIPTVRGELQAVDSSQLTKIQKDAWDAAIRELDVMSTELYRLLQFLPK